MILGAFHFANPNRDLVKQAGIDVLTPARQQQIDDVVNQLAAFKPTRIAVERPRSSADSIATEYQQYRAGAFTLPRSEMYQIGFRLAKRQNLAQIDAVDVKQDMDMGSVLQYAQTKDPAFVKRLMGGVAAVEAQMNAMQRDGTIGANLRYLNTPDVIAASHAPYIDMATVGGGDNLIGAKVVGQWYARNVQIFGNLAALAKPGERVLLIIGQGHAAILRSLIALHPGMELMEPNALLK